MKVRLKTITNETYTYEINENEISFEDFMRQSVMKDGYLCALDIIKRVVYINSKYIESVTIMEDK